jgi:sterol 24-C-methyltransferase
MSSAPSTQSRAYGYYRDTQTRESVGKTIRSYLRFYQEGEEAFERRHTDYAEMVNQYYDLATDFYERGWGQSFHFAPRYAGEGFLASLARHEHYLALRLGLERGEQVLDVGCGVGGPMRAIARFSGAHVHGVNNNAYQLEKLERYNIEAGLGEQCRGIKADFMALPVADGSYDAAYAVEATCHAPDRVGVFSEIARVLKPGGKFAVYEWCLTDRYDSTNKEHAAIKHGIETGDSLPDIATMPAILEALEASGLRVIESEDRALTSDEGVPWYKPLKGDELSLTGLRRSIPGRFVTNHLVWLLEQLRIAPSGSKAVSDMLNVGADALVAGGELGIFTPSFFVLAEKPAS